MMCPACTADVPDDDLFCELCGAALHDNARENASETRASCSCGAAADDVDEDGFCLGCGKRVRRPASDHIELSISCDFAAVSDRGLRHDRNEDRFALARSPDGYVLVVCDGVSTTSNAEVASATVADHVCRQLTEPSPHGDQARPDRAVAEAIRAANIALQTQTSAHADVCSPSTTVVAAVVAGDEVVLGWAGDSRAYWIDATGASLLTRDHSWLNEALSAGELTADEAHAAPEAHAITRWLGADAEAEAEPEVVRKTIASPGTLLLCTDGLWNYLEDDAALFKLVGNTEDGDPEALGLANRLVAFAKEQGGRDNITVAILRVGQPVQNQVLADSTEQFGDLIRTDDTEEQRHGGSVQG